MKTKRTLAVLFVVTVVAIYLIHKNWGAIDLAWHTDRSIYKTFHDIEIGWTQEQVTTLMGEPTRQLQTNNSNELYLIWRRYKGTSYTTKIVDAHVVEKYDRFGS